MNGSSLGGAGIATSKQPGGASPSNASTMSSGRAISATSSARSKASAGSARFPTITGWTNSTATCRASDRAAGDSPTASSLPAGKEPVRHLRAETRDVSASAAKNARLASVRAARRSAAACHAGAPALVVSATSQSRTSSIPSPVRALTSIRGTPGWTPSRW